MDAAEYKHVVLGLIFLKYVSDIFTKRREELETLTRDESSDYFMPNEAARLSVLESRDEYTSQGVFWIPEGNRWEDLRKNAKQTDIGARLDAAMDAIERENPTLKGVLPKNFARRELTPETLGGLIDTFSREDLAAEEHQDLDVLGRVFEYMLSQFASAEGKLGGEFFTPRSVVQLMVEMLEPFNGRVYDPACGSGGMFVQADRFVKAHGGVRNDISVFGQEQNPTTWRLAKMNLALRGIDANLGPEWGDSFTNNLHPDLRADFIMANPPFNISDWGADKLQGDVRWKFGEPPAGNANYAWIQHMIHHLAPGGTMATILANSSLSAERTGEKEIRIQLVDKDLVDCIVVLPSNLFFTTSIPVCLWIVTKDKTGTQSSHENPLRDRSGEVLFIDARNLGTMKNKTIRELSEGDISSISTVYHEWRSLGGDSVNIPSFARTVSTKQILSNEGALSPNLYIVPEIPLPDLTLTKKRLDQSLLRGKSVSEARRTNSDLAAKAFREAGMEEFASLDLLALSEHQLIELQDLLFDSVFFDFSKHEIDLEASDLDAGFAVPSGWKLLKLGEISSITDCLHSKKPESVQFQESAGALLEVSNIQDDGLLNLTELNYISNQDYQQWTKNIELVAGDCIITNTGRVGAVARIPINHSFAMGRNMTALRTNNPNDAIYLFRYLKSSYMRRETYHRTDIGTILDSLNVKGIRKIRILWPDEQTRSEYASYALPLQNLIETRLAFSTVIEMDS